MLVRLEDPNTGQVPSVDQASAIVTEDGGFIVRFTYPTDPRWSQSEKMLITVVDPAVNKRVSVSFRVTVVVAPTNTPEALPTAEPTETASRGCADGYARPGNRDTRSTDRDPRPPVVVTRSSSRRSHPPRRACRPPRRARRCPRPSSPTGAANTMPT